MDLLAEDALVQILIRINDPKALANCTLVCRRWAEVLSSYSSFWVAQCKFDKITIPGPLLVANARRYNWRVDYRLIWRKNPYGRNLIKNDSGQEGFKHWNIDPNHWNEDQTIIGGVVMHPIEKPPRMAELDIQSCFATSYFQCSKSQTVDLCAEGIETWILDEIKPTICIGEWHAASRDCGSKYGLRVALLDAVEEEEGAPFTDECVVAQWSGGHWEKSTHKFTGYPRGVRYVSFHSWGVDTQFWAGFFGSKMAKASVVIEL